MRGLWQKFFRNRKLREQMFLSYGLVGILPFLIFSFCILRMTSRQIQESARDSLETMFHNSSVSLSQNVEKVETALNIIAMDSRVSSILNTAYESSYQKYEEVTQHFDPMVNTVLLTNPELEGLRFYVNNNLAGVRKNFLSFAEAEALPGFSDIQEQYTPQWFYDNGEFRVFQKVYSPAFNGTYALLEARIPYDRIVDSRIFENLSFKITLRGGGINRQDDIRPSSAGGLYQSVPIMNGAGLLEAGAEGGYPAKELFLVVLGISAAFLLLLFTISGFSKDFSRRIHSINRTLAETVQKRFSVTFSEEYADEIGELTAMLNRMIRETKQLIQDVYEAQIEKREYEMKALQAQLNPHFLYNTLSAINWHALTTENVFISDIVTSLSKFYRTALNSGDSMTTVENELENIRAYVSIQQKIHSGSFDAEYEIAPEILPCRMPNLILQPIVENAIEHGIDLMTEGRGRLSIRARREGEGIRFEIADNGVGIAAEKMEDLLQKDSKTYGLRNVDKRLQLCYRDKYRLEYSSSHGTVFRLFFPWM